ncbi:MAG: amidohydrolase [Lachnospiraceae bacterium]|nr:amidohydrolase [Lachnospiraceae bacterium]
MNIRLYNALILTMEENRPVFRGEILIRDEKILAVIEERSGCEDTGAREAQISCKDDVIWDVQIDCKGNLLMPGFKNAHTHSGMTFLRSMADDLPLQEWLNDRVFPLEAKLTPEDIYHLSGLAILEYLTSGVTSIFDMYLDNDATAQACMDMGMRCVLASGLNDFTSSIEKMEMDYVKWNLAKDGKVDSTINQITEHPRRSLITYRLAFHAEYTCSKELLSQVAALARRYQAPVYTHMAETIREVENCKHKYGMTPAVFLESLGMFEYGGGGYHCVHMSEEDMEVFSRHGMYVITNPGSNTKLASGIAPIAEYVRRKIPVAIGTDGPASNNCLDMFREMFLVTGLSKLKEQDASSMDASKVLEMATVNGAKAMGLGTSDVLAVGKKADIIMIDLHQPNMQPIHNIPKNLVYSGSKSNVCMTMIGGKILYQNGEFYVGESPERIYAECNQIVKRMLNNITL